MRVVWGKDMRECATDVVMAELVAEVAAVVVGVAVDAFAVAALAILKFRTLNPTTCLHRL